VSSPATREAGLVGNRGRLGRAFLISLLFATSGIPTARVGADPPPKPRTIVLIVTDDQRFDTLWAMPLIQARLIDKGVRFTNAFVVNSSCCPSRASILTGQYSHTTEVWTNSPPLGGLQSFDDSSTLATWLDAAGYTTGFFGRYLTHYSTSYVPPGWDRWFSFIGKGDSSFENLYYRYDVNDDGVIRHFGRQNWAYSTSVLSKRAISLIRGTDGPLFLMFAPRAPHRPAVPAPGDEDAFPDLLPYRPPNHDESDVSDKPDWVQALPRLGEEKIAQIDQLRTKQYRSLLAVDRAVGRIVRTLKETRRLGSSTIIFMSDNGYHWGEHRWRDKLTAYEESIRIPMVVRDDQRVAVPRTDTRPVLNIDVAPTIAELAGVAPEAVEGQSLLPLLDEGATPLWRTDFLVEHVPAGAGLYFPTFCALRTDNHSYVSYTTGEEELYELDRDPYQLNNLAADPRSELLLTQMRIRLAELCNPAPPDVPPPGK
jgi:N-acetylglucosamine-6-sulfatase